MDTTFTLIALLSTYKEGPLAHAAITSALKATPHVYVYDGPAGMDADGPDTDYSRWNGLITLKRGRWKTDAHKRSDMIKVARQFRPQPVWSVWIDGDEVLCNAEYLTDWVQMWLWQDEADQAQAPADFSPRLGWPIRCVELDGSVALTRGRVMRADLIDSYSVSSSVFKDAMGNTHAEGAVIERFSHWWEPRAQYMLGKISGVSDDLEHDRLMLPPPLPCEPFIMHRSSLRHPARRGSRLHTQEPREIEEQKRLLGLEG